MYRLENTLTDYAASRSKPEDPLLKELSRETYLKVLNPRMLSGHLQGLVLEFISKMIGPEYILEIGTFTGYSALCLSKGLPEGGKLITLEQNDELKKYAEKYFMRSGRAEKIEMLTGNALTLIPRLNYSFDLVFIDADKTQYSDYFDLVIDKIPHGGYILADNVLWNGKVLEPASADDHDTKGIIAFNEKIAADPRVENVILPIRDGINLIRKK